VNNDFFEQNQLTGYHDVLKPLAGIGPPHPKSKITKLSGFLRLMMDTLFNKKSVDETNRGGLYCTAPTIFIRYCAA